MTHKSILYLAFSLLLFSSCENQDDFDDGAQNQKRATEVAVTGAVIRNHTNYVDITGRVNLDLLNDDVRSTAEYGIEISLYASFDDYNSTRYQPLSESNGLFLCRFTKLKPNKQYWYHTYVQVGDKVYYGKRATVTTPDNPLIPAHLFVDLGLSDGTLWATCNIGAEEPYEDGMYFAWGEIEEKNEYNLSTYKWYGIRGWTKIEIGGYEEVFGYVKYNGGDFRFLCSEDDAATVLWGDEWQIPTRKQFEILLKETTQEYKKYDGVWGLVIKSKKNGNSIFLPAASQKEKIANQSNDRYGKKEDCKGFYRTSELNLYVQYEDTFSWFVEDHVYCLCFDYAGNEINPYQERYTGMPIRPVKSVVVQE